MKNNDTSLKKIKDLLYVIIALLVVSLIIGIINTSNIVALSSNNNTTNNNEEETNSDYDVSKFTAVDFNGFKDLIASKGTHVIYIGRSTCGYCVKFLPVLKQGQEDYNFTTVYFDITKVLDFSGETLAYTDKDAYDYIVGLNSFFEENFSVGATPLAVIYRDGKFVAGSVGYIDYAAYSKFLEDNGINK